MYRKLMSKICNAFKKLSQKEKKELDAKHKEMFREFIAEYDERVQNLMFNVMPSKIKEIEEIFKQTENTHFETDSLLSNLPLPQPNENDDGTDESQTENVLGKRKRSDDADGERSENESKLLKADEMRRLQLSVDSNETVERVMQALKRECVFFVKTINTFKLWIQLNIPKIEDGNNFGVNVQEEVVTDLSSRESVAFGLLDEVRKYHVERARLVRKALRYPRLRDLRRALAEHDERAFHMFALDFLEIRNYYLTLLDAIKKNYDKLKKPRGAGGSAFRAMF